ncbi:MAG: hypothetical protein WCT04_14905 [Planctomycetota bacterium]
MKNKSEDYDNPWKEILAKRFELLMHFFFPVAAAEINWKRKPEFLDKEFRAVTKHARTGKRNADALIKVFLKNGSERWVLIHIEVQAQPDPNFAERMYIYNYRIFDLYKKRVASFAILADEDEDWRPTSFEYELWGTRAGLHFATAKLTDFRNDVDALLKHENPFALVVLAHLKTQDTRNNEGERFRWKKTLFRNLLRFGMAKVEIREVLLTRA